LLEGKVEEEEKTPPKKHFTNNSNICLSEISCTEPVNITLSGVINWVCIYYLDVFLSLVSSDKRKGKLKK